MATFFEILAIILICIPALIFIYLFPLWVAIHAGRKNYKGWRTAIIIGYIFGCFPGALISLPAFFKVKPYHPNLDSMPHVTGSAGTGTTFYSADNKTDDGSFVTTQWVTCFWIPLVPIQSYRIVRGSTEYKGGLLSAVKQEITRFTVLEKLPLDGRQVLKTWGMSLAIIFLIVMFFLTINPVPVMGILIAGLAIFCLIFGYFRVFRWK